MTTLLPTDADDNPIPAVRFKDGGAHKIITSDTSARNLTAIDAETRVISIYATEDIYIRFGGAGVTATTDDHFFPKNVYYDIAVGGGRTPHFTHIAALQVSAGGELHISEKQ